MQLKDKVIVITGGAQGLGYAMAERLGKHKAEIVLFDCDQAALDSAILRLKKSHISAEGVVVDVRQEQSVTEAFSQLKTSKAGIDVLINNAGILRDGFLVKAKDGHVEKKMSLSQWQSVIDVNLTGVFLCAREAAALMIDSGHHGVIINMSSVARQGNMGQTNYAAAKAGVVAMTKTWARELGQHGIRVCAIAPGVIGTAMTDAMKPVMRERLMAMTQVNRLGTPDEIAHTAQFLIENDFITGRVVEVDGGISL